MECNPPVPNKKSHDTYPIIDISSTKYVASNQA